MGSTASVPKKTSIKSLKDSSDHNKTVTAVNSATNDSAIADDKAHLPGMSDAEKEEADDKAHLPGMSDAEKEESILSSIASKLKELYEMKEPWDEEGNKIFDMLFKRYYGKKKRRKLIAELMISNKTLDVCVKIVDFSHTTSDDKLTYLKSKIYKTMKIVLQNYFGASCEFAQYACEQKVFIDRTMRDFSNPDLDVSMMSKKRNRLLIKTSLGILNNVARHCKQSEYLIRKDEGIQLLLNYYSSTFLIIKAHVMLLLAYCINEEENEKIVTGTGVIEFLIRVLGNAVHTLNHVAKPYNFSATELMEGLDKLAFNDDNKKSFVDAGILPLINIMLKEKFSQEEHEVACHCLWTLTFHPDNKEHILKEVSLIESVRRIQADPSSDASTVRSCDGIMFVIEGKKQGEEGGESPKHIMISYQWDVQDIVLKISEKLKSLGFSVWIDVDQMSQGSILSSMANAVENSSLLLVGVTEGYKNSNACRTEAEYAYKLSKPIFPLLLQDSYSPDGWLGAFVGVQFYMKITDSAALDDTSFDALVQKLKSKMTSPSRDQRDDFDVTVNDSGAEPNSPPPPSALVPRSKLTSCASWTKDEVRDWVAEHVATKKDLLPQFDGAALCQMFKLLQRSPDVYYRSLREDFKLEWIDLFHLTNALESLLVGKS